MLVGWFTAWTAAAAPITGTFTPPLEWQPNRLLNSRDVHATVAVDPL